MTATWAMGKALSELMQRHGQTLATLALVPLSESTPTPMLLSGFAARLDVDIERVAFAPFAFDPLPTDVPLCYDHQPEQRAGRIELLAHNDRGELMIRPMSIIPRPAAATPSALAAMCWITRCTTPIAPSFFARVEKVPASRDQPGACAGRPQRQVLRRELPSPMFAFGAAIQQANHR
jgi:hypothetical protein